MSKIEWTEKTWNPIVGCSKVSAGCKNCYAIGMAWRLQHIGHSAAKYAGTVEKTSNGQRNWTGKINIIEKEFVKPFTWKKPSMVFVNSESDLFHESVPFQVVRALFGVMSVCEEHTFQILTKRPQRMLDFFKWLELMDPDWQDDPANYAYDLCVEHGIETGCGSAFETEAWPLKNVWLGVSVESQQAANERIPLLLQVPAAVRFLSCEPLLSPVNLTHIDADGAGHTEYCQINALTGRHTDMARPCADVNKIDWVIVGGESGHGARPLHPEWVRSLRTQCQKAGTKFFFKQWGMYTDVNNILPVPMEDFSKNLKSGKWVGVDNTGAIVDHVSGPNKAILMAKVGKDKAGRLLDGREWNEFPVSGKRKPDDDPDLHAGGFDY